MEILYSLALIVASTVLLWKGADLIVDNAADIARRLGISELVIGLTVVAAGTSTPEFLVTLTAAQQGFAEISLSNILGSNIFNLGLILGLMALIRPIPTHPALLYRDGLLLLGLTLGITMLIFCNYLGRVAGLGLLLGLAAYGLLLFWKVPREILAAVSPADPGEGAEPFGSWKNYPLLALGFLGVALGGRFMVQGATDLALMVGVSQWVIGVTIVAAGTSLPELATCLAASLKGRNDMILGNLLGSDIFNFAGVLGLTLVLSPLQVPAGALGSMLVLNVAVLAVLVFMRSGWRISRLEGALLVSVALLRWAMDIGLWR
jgi:cation:H+ antiporter